MRNIIQYSPDAQVKNTNFVPFTFTLVRNFIFICGIPLSPPHSQIDDHEENFEHWENVLRVWNVSFCPNFD